MKKNYLILSLAISFLLLLGGCARAPLVATAPTTYQPYLSWQARQAQLTALKNWTLRSEMSVRQQNQVSFISLYWQQQGDNFDQRLSGPFSMGGVRVSGHPGEVTLWRSAQDRISAKTPEELLQRTFNWQLPISNLYYWIRGIPAPNSPSQEQFDRYHRLSVLTQQGWTIQYLSYQQINNLDLPREMLLISADLQVKMFIRQWQIN